MFLLLLGASLTFSAALLATVVFTEGAVVALRTAAQIIGWLFLVATAIGLGGLRRTSLGPLCAASVTLCSGLAVLYMSYFFDWHEVQRPVMRAAAVEPGLIRPVAYTYKVVELPVQADKIVKPPAPRPKLVTASSTRIALGGPSDTCSTLTGVESLQCNRCAEEQAFSWVMCQERVRREYCESELGDERICPAPFPQSHPG